MAKKRACATCSKTDVKYFITSQHVEGHICPKCHDTIEKAAKKCKKGGNISLVLNDDGELVVKD